MSNYLEPGTYVEVKNQVTPPALTPGFVTAIIGTTSTDKPVTKVLTRDTTTLSAKTLRRDTLDTTVTSVESMVDEFGVTYIKDQDWSWLNVSSTAYVSMGANFVSTNPISGVTFMPFDGPSLNGGGVTPITSVDGTQTLVYTFAGNTLTWGGGAPLALSLGSGVYELTDVATKKIRVSVETTQLPTSGTTTDAVTVSTLGPLVGVDYTVSYHKAKTSTDLDPAIFDDLTSLQEFHGAVLDDSVTYPEVSNAEALSIGAEPYFAAGGGSVVVVPVRDKKIDAASGWDIYNASASIANAAWVGAVVEALVKLEDEAAVSCVIVLSPTEKSSTTGNYREGIYSAVISHLNRMNSLTEGKPRMAILGARANTTNEKTYEESAAFGTNENIVYLAPATASKAISGYTKLLNGATIASGLAGICSTPDYNAGEPITGKPMTMFDSITDPFSGRLQRNRVAQAGVTLIETQDSQPVVRHFLTTNQTSILTGEAKVTRIKIDTRRTIRQTLNATVINRRLVDGETIALVNSLIGMVLNQKIRDQVINAFNIKSVAVDPIDARQLNVKVEIKPTFDLNYILVEETFVTA